MDGEEAAREASTAEEVEFDTSYTLTELSMNRLRSGNAD